MSQQSTSRPLTPAEQREFERLSRLYEVQQGLPHLFGFPWYRWAKDFFDSENKACFICAANQVSKSSTQIRKFIHWATDIKMWPKLWPNLMPGQKPNQFWYFYPTAEVWSVEWETKWEPDFMPRGDLKNDPQYGWKPIFDKGFIKQIDFHSGVTIYCKTYAQKKKDLQSGSVYMLGLDEEAPAEYMPELQARIRATDGYLSGVFTATIGQEYWRRVMEPKNREEELYRDAFKRTVSLFDSQKYVTGKPSRWTDARIKQVIAECATEAEVQRRVFGRFVKASGLKFESFELERNMEGSSWRLPKSWGIFSGVDPGSGGQSGHPAAMVFIAVRPDYREGVVFRCWRGDGIPTANPDILEKYRELKGELLLMAQVYDYRDKDFFLIAQGQGESFQPANKARDEGFGLLNSLFKNGMLKIKSGDPELSKLVTELQSLPAVTDSRKKDVDDLADALRYAAMAIPWDFSHLPKPVDVHKYADPMPDSRTSEQRQRDELLQARRDFVLNKRSPDTDIEAEFEYWNDLSGNGYD